MKKVKLFEEFHKDLDALHEGMFSNIDIIGKEAQTKADFIKEVKDFLKKNAANKEIADNESFLEELAGTYFDKDGNKKDVE